MFIVTNRIPVSKGYEADFEERFRKRASLIDAHPGFVSNRILRPVSRRLDHKTGAWKQSDELQYYIVETYWETEDDFWAWTRSEDFMKAHSNRPPAEMFAGKNVLEIHEIAIEALKREA